MTKTIRKVLVVVDGDDQTQTLRRGLRYVGVACTSVRTAAEARAVLDGPDAERVDLLLADLTAPDLPVARLVEETCTARPDLPVLVVTGLVLSPEVKALRARGVAILRKPFTPQQLFHAIETLPPKRGAHSKGDDT
jgi:DNA-binding NtrC family response regulator